MSYTHEQKLKFGEYLRANPSPPEILMIKELDKYNFNYIFQPLVFGFFPDFLFPQHRAILEIDGKQHLKNKKYDSKRDLIFRSKGFKVLRIPAKYVFNNPFSVLNAVSEFLTGKKIKQR